MTIHTMASRLTFLPRTIFSSLCKVTNRPLIHSTNNYVINTSRIATTPTENSELKWEICVGACIVRSPVIAAPLNTIEENFQDLLGKLHIRSSLKCDHEMKKEDEDLKAEMVKAGGAELGLEDATNQTAAEFDNYSRDELNSFKFASCKTEFEEDLTSCWRQLERNLILAVHQRLGNDNQWILPQTPWVPGETLRQTAERITNTVCGSEFPVRFFGNEPCGVYKYKYSKEARQKGYIGAKVFFYKGFVSKPQLQIVSSLDDIKEHKWLTQEQLSENMKSQYYKSLDQFLISDQ